MPSMTADPTEAGKWCFDCGGIHLPQRSDGTATGEASAEKLPDEPDQELEAVEPQTEVQSPENAGGEMDIPCLQTEHASSVASSKRKRVQTDPAPAPKRSARAPKKKHLHPDEVAP